MRFVSALGAIVLVVPALGVPTRIPITKRAGPVKPDSYIVTFKDHAAKDAFVKSKPTFVQPDSRIVYDDWTVIPAIAVNLLGVPDLDMIRAAPGIESVQQDGILSISYEQGIDGFDSIGYKQLAEPPESEVVKRTANGNGVEIYGIDTGIYIEHNCFEGRAKWGIAYGGYEQKDGNGHGTHTAATAAGRGYGVAPGAKLIAVKVLSDAGSGSTSDVISGINYAATESKKSGNPSIATMSLGGSPDSTTDQAVQNAINGGLHFTIAAGNSNMLADTSSPARVPEANTIGAVDKDNQKAQFSNYGKLIDVWAPGVDIKSAWIGNPNAEHTISGTSMATPMVAGCAATYLSQYGQMSPEDLSKLIVANSKPDTVTFSVADKVAKDTSTHNSSGCERPSGSF